MTHESEPHDLIELDELAGLLRDREGPAQPLRRQRLGPSRRLSLALGILLAIAAAAAIAIFSERGGEGKPSSSGVIAGSCALAVEWQGTRYYGGRANQLIALGGKLGKGTTPPCGDVVGPGAPPPGPPGSVTIVSIDGVSPRAAIATLGERTVYYLAPGYLPQVPNTALHDIVFGPHPNIPDERRGDCKGAEQTEVKAKVRAANTLDIFVTLLDSPDLPRENTIFPEARTVIEGGGAEPHVSPGDVIRAQVLVCRHPDDPHFMKLVATRLFLHQDPAASG
jgi:hypothetical protein